MASQTDEGADETSQDQDQGQRNGQAGVPPMNTAAGSAGAAPLMDLFAQPATSASLPPLAPASASAPGLTRLFQPPPPPAQAQPALLSSAIKIPRPSSQLNRDTTVSHTNATHQHDRPAPSPTQAVAYGPRSMMAGASNQEGGSANEMTSLLFTNGAGTTSNTKATIDGNIRTANTNYGNASLLRMFEKEAETKGAANSTNGNGNPTITITTTTTSTHPANRERRSLLDRFRQVVNRARTSQWLHPTTIAGSFMFLLYHVVFCLAMGSAIQRPSSSSQSILGAMAKMSTVGILFAGPLYIFRLGSHIPAVYPSIDLFLAPFLADAAVIVDTTLVEQHRRRSNDAESYPELQFYATFAVLVGIGMLWAGLLLQLAASFKLANLGTFLPYSVLCGFFSAVGVLLWALAFSVDTSGLTWQAVFIQSKDPSVIINSLVHHLPSLFIGIIMNRLGPKNPFSVIFVLLATQVVFYLVMWCTGTSLKEAQADGWFWSRDQLVFEKDTPVGFRSWSSPPAPFGGISVLFHNDAVDWVAVWEGLSSMASLAVLYLLRSSIHASALKKNVGNLVRRVPVAPSTATSPNTTSIAHDDTLLRNDHNQRDRTHAPTMRESLTHTKSFRFASDMVGSIQQGYQQVSMSLSENQLANPSSMSQLSPSKTPFRPRNTSDIAGEFDLAFSEHPTVRQIPGSNEEDDNGYVEVKANTPKVSLEDIFLEYGYSLCMVAFCGGFGCCPTVATSNTMYAIGAEGYAPQLGSILLLAIFYLTSFEMVQYIPKAAFSSLLVLGAVDTFTVWFFRSFRKTQDIWEWSVNPIIVLFSLVVGFLNAVFLGVGISTFVFVGAFFKVGSVKYAATAVQIRSSIERPIPSSEWLDDNGDFIQVLVLQNYLFFGNANSLFSYITTMFEDIEGEHLNQIVLIPKPEVLLIDLSLISGMDTSTVDVFNDVKSLCKANGCKLFLCGMPSSIRKAFALVGLKPETNTPRAQRLLRFFADLDAALGRAEDYLLKAHNVQTEYIQPQHLVNANASDGFRHALFQIDQQHNQNFAQDLVGLAEFTESVELEPGQALFENYDSQPVEACRRGLYFVQWGLLKIERKTSETFNRSRSHMSLSQRQPSVSLGRTEAGANTLTKLHARSTTLNIRAMASRLGSNKRPTTNFRLARIGPGWVCGMTELTTGVSSPGQTVAISHCRLHHLPIENIERLETEQPKLIMRLYKMISHLMAQHQEVTIQQLATMHSIMSSPAHLKPMGRSA